MPRWNTEPGSHWRTCACTCARRSLLPGICWHIASRAAVTMPWCRVPGAGALLVAALLEISDDARRTAQNMLERMPEWAVCSRSQRSLTRKAELPISSQHDLHSECLPTVARIRTEEAWLDVSLGLQGHAVPRQKKVSVYIQSPLLYSCSPFQPT